MENIPVYYILDRQLPGLDPGEMFHLGSDLGGDPIIFSDKSEIKFPLDYTTKYPDWFISVSMEEHRKAFKESFMEVGRQDGFTEEQIEVAWQKFLN